MTVKRKFHPMVYPVFFYTQLWFQTMIYDDLRVISDVFMKRSQEKNIGKNRIDHGCLCEMEFTLVSLYSTEITSCRSWFLEYKLTRPNSVPHGQPWSILYYLHIKPSQGQKKKKKIQQFVTTNPVNPNHDQIIKYSFQQMGIIKISKYWNQKFCISQQKDYMIQFWTSLKNIYRRPTEAQGWAEQVLWFHNKNLHNVCATKEHPYTWLNSCYYLTKHLKMNIQTMSLDESLVIKYFYVFFCHRTCILAFWHLCRNITLFAWGEYYVPVSSPKFQKYAFWFHHVYFIRAKYAPFKVW